jgi:hypothetical protein
MNQHPSYALLDAAALGDESAAAQIAPHLGDCAACRDHIKAAQMPADDLALARLQRRAQETPKQASVIRWSYAAAAALVCVLAVGVANVLAPRHDVVTTKGAPSVAVYVKRGDTVFLWNGRAPLKVGDTIRLKIVPEDARFVEVRSDSGEALYHGALSPPETELPVAWRLDDRGTSERLRVGFAVQEGKEISHVDLVLPKEGAP